MGVTLLLGLLLAQAGEPALPGPPRVTSVELRLPPDTDPQLVADAPDLVAVRKGQELSKRAVRRTIERLVETGRLGDVVVRTIDVEGGVEVVIEATPLRPLGEAYLEGNRAISSSELLATARLEPGAELSVERLAEAEDAMRSLYRRHGFQKVEVTSQRTLVEGRLDVLFTVNEGEPTRLTSVVFAGETGLPVVELLAILQLELGAVVEQKDIEAGIDRLRERLRKEHFYRARVDAPTYDADGHLEVPLHSGPRFEIVIDGNESFSDSVMSEVNNYDPAEALEDSVIARLAQRLTSFYRHQGFHDARVSQRLNVSPDGSRAVVLLHVEEGPRLLVKKLWFDGNAAVSTKELTRVLAEVMRSSAPLTGRLKRVTDGLQAHGRVNEPSKWQPFEPEPETVLVDEVWRDAATAMQALYRDRGYLTATVTMAEAELDADGAVAGFVVKEGPRVDYRSVTVLGLPEGAVPSDKSWVALGTPFSRRSLENIKQQIQDTLNAEGWLFARVDASYKVENDTEGLALFRTVPGPRVQLGKVIVRGLRRTVETVVRGQLVVVEGRPLKPDDILDTQRNLIGLGIFKTADVRILSPETVEPVKDLLVEVTEQQRLSGEFGLGYSYAEGPRFVVDVQYPNLGGRAISVVGHAQLNYFAASGLAISRVVNVSELSALELFGGSANISISNRGLIPFDIGSRIDLLVERVFRPSFFFTRAAATPGLDWPTQIRLPFVKFAPLKNTVLLQYEFDVSRVQQTSSASASTVPLLQSDQERLRFLPGIFVLQTVRLSDTIDLRDNPAVPHKGFILQGSIERTAQIYAVDENQNPVTVQFWKLSGLFTTYVPVTPTTVLALSVRGGRIFTAAAGSVTPPVKRFFMGGSSTIRGFQEQNMLAADTRAGLRDEVQNCQALAQSAGCTAGAAALGRGQNVVSQGGELFYVGKAELRFPVFSSLDLGVFLEAGDLWLGAPTAFTLRPVAGTGVRYVTPIGPLALDIGFNLRPDQVVNEPTFQVHFNVGVF